MQIGLILLRRDHLQLRFCDLGRNTELCRITWNQPFLHSALQRGFQHNMDPMHGRAAEAWLFVFGVFPNPAVFQQVFVELLDVQRGQLIQLNVAQARSYMMIDVALIIPRCRFPHVWLRVQ